MDEENQLRERVIQYAGSRFFSEGFSRITTEELSRELGISKKTLYREFGSKETIVRAVVQQQLQSAERELAEAFDDESRSFIERLGAQLHVATRIVSTLGKPFLIDIARYAPKVWEEIQEFRHERVFSRLEGIIDRGKEEGTIRREVNPKLLMMIVVTVADHLLVPEKLSRMDLSPELVIRHMGMLITEGALTAAGRSRLDDAHLLENGAGNLDA